jgi:hypothetical protein
MSFFSSRLRRIACVVSFPGHGSEDIPRGPGRGFARFRILKRPPALTVFLAVLLFTTCSKTPPSGPAVTAAEAWRIVESGTQNHASIDLKKNSGGAIACTGNWYYEFFGDDITCKIMQGSVRKDTSFLDFTCTGTASYPPDGTGYVESSGFTLRMSGQFKNGLSSGDWNIAFADTDWNEWAPEGVFSGQRQSGEGITE